MMKSNSYFLGLLFVFALCGQRLLGEDVTGRLTVLVANSKYEEVLPLKNPANDINLIGQTLKGKKHYDLSLEQMKGLLSSLKKEAETASEIVFYFAGHGVEIEGMNYLLPVDCRADSVAALKESSISLREILDALQELKATKVLVFDCCRDDPFETVLAGVSGGFANLEMPEKTMLIYSGAPGKSVPDGEGRNSPFAQGLFVEMREGLTLIDQCALVDEKTSNQRVWVKYDGNATEFTELKSFMLLPGKKLDWHRARGIHRLTFGDTIEVVGILQQVKTYDANGTAVFPFYLKTEDKLEVLEPDEINFGLQGETPNADGSGVFVDGVELQIIGDGDLATGAAKNLEKLEALRDKKVKAQIHISGHGDEGWYLWDFGGYLDDASFIALHQAQENLKEVIAPRSVPSSSEAAPENTPSKRGSIVYQGSDGVSLRKEPGGAKWASLFASRLTSHLPVSSEPRHSNRLVWREVSVEGWLASSNKRNGNRYVEVTGERAKVIWSSAQKSQNYVSLRTQASTKAGKLGHFYRGAEGVYLDAKSGSQYNWVKVRFTAWVAEKSPRGTLLLSIAE